jgi:hypothetical protein
MLASLTDVRHTTGIAALSDTERESGTRGQVPWELGNASRFLDFGIRSWHVG